MSTKKAELFGDAWIIHTKRIKSHEDWANELRAILPALHGCLHKAIVQLTSIPFSAPSLSQRYMISDIWAHRSAVETINRFFLSIKSAIAQKMLMKYESDVELAKKIRGQIILDLSSADTMALGTLMTTLDDLKQQLLRITPVEDPHALLPSPRQRYLSTLLNHYDYLSQLIETVESLAKKVVEDDPNVTSDDVTTLELKLQELSTSMQQRQYLYYKALHDLLAGKVTGIEHLPAASCLLQQISALDFKRTPPRTVAEIYWGHAYLIFILLEFNLGTHEHLNKALTIFNIPELPPYQRPLLFGSGTAFERMVGLPVLLNLLHKSMKLDKKQFLLHAFNCMPHPDVRDYLLELFFDHYFIISTYTTPEVIQFISDSESLIMDTTVHSANDKAAYFEKLKQICKKLAKAYNIYQERLEREDKESILHQYFLEFFSSRLQQPSCYVYPTAESDATQSEDYQTPEGSEGEVDSSYQMSF